jgi:hypothetical protein
MPTAAASPTTAATRSKLIEAITSPIGFFVLALLIVEVFLATVLVGGNLEPKDKITGVWLGVGMFVLVVLVVFLLVCFKPQSFVFDRQAHLDQLKMEHERLRATGGSGGLREFAGKLESTLLREIASEELASKLSQASQADVLHVLKEKAGKVADDIKQSQFISVDISAFGNEYGVLTFPVGALKDMNALTDEVYFTLPDTVRPYAYGTDWVLRDKQTKNVFRNTRMLTNTPVGQPIADIRSMGEMGIRPGMELEAVPLTAPHV